MGFMDKAKKLAEQAQEKLDDVQTQFNEKQQGGQQAGGATQEYDQHGRPAGGAHADAVPDQKAPTTAVPDPIEGAAPAVPPAAPTGATPAVAEPAGDASPATDEVQPASQPSPTEQSDGDHTPPGVTHGDPLG